MNFAKCELLRLYNSNIKDLYSEVHGPERHEMLTVLNDYYGCTKCFKFGIFCTNPD